MQYDYIKLYKADYNDLLREKKKEFFFLYIRKIL